MPHRSGRHERADYIGDEALHSDFLYNRRRRERSLADACAFIVLFRRHDVASGQPEVETAPVLIGFPSVLVASVCLWNLSFDYSHTHMDVCIVDLYQILCIVL